MACSLANIFSCFIVFRIPSLLLRYLIITDLRRIRACGKVGKNRETGSTDPLLGVSSLGKGYGKLFGVLWISFFPQKEHSRFTGYAHVFHMFSTGS
jgi:hypothetical protein